MDIRHNDNMTICLMAYEYRQLNLNTVNNGFIQKGYFSSIIFGKSTGNYEPYPIPLVGFRVSNRTYDIFFNYIFP